VFTGKFVGTGPSSYEKRIYWAAVSQVLRNTGLVDVPYSENFQHAVCSDCRDNKTPHIVCQRFAGSIQPDNVLYLYVYLDTSLSNFPDHPDDG